jgi:hypothetical protein
MSGLSSTRISGNDEHQVSRLRKHDFFEEIKGLPFRVLRAEETLREIGIVE